MKVEDLVNIHWMDQDTLKMYMDKGLLYTQSEQEGLFVKFPHYSNILLHSAIHYENLWIDKNEI